MVTSKRNRKPTQQTSTQVTSLTVSSIPKQSTNQLRYAMYAKPSKCVLRPCGNNVFWILCIEQLVTRVPIRKKQPVGTADAKRSKVVPPDVFVDCTMHSLYFCFVHYEPHSFCLLQTELWTTFLVVVFVRSTCTKLVKFICWDGVQCLINVVQSSLSFMIMTHIQKHNWTCWCPVVRLRVNKQNRCWAQEIIPLVIEYDLLPRCVREAWIPTPPSFGIHNTLGW